MQLSGASLICKRCQIGFTHKLGLIVLSYLVGIGLQKLHRVCSGKLLTFDGQFGGNVYIEQSFHRSWLACHVCRRGARVV